jgi:hypothetical protein
LRNTKSFGLLLHQRRHTKKSRRVTRIEIEFILSLLALASSA